MGSVVGTLLPLATAVAISPVPVVVVILLLLAPGTRGSGGGFLLGWTGGIVLATGGSVVAVEAGNAGDSASILAAWLQLVLGVLLISVGIRQWIRRRRGAGLSRNSGWAAAIATVTPQRAAMLGLLLSAANPKNVTLCVAAGVAVAGGELDTGKDVLAVVLFTAVAGSTVAVPVVAHAVAAGRIRGPLEKARTWLYRASGTSVAILRVAVGAVLAGTALDGLV